MLRKWLGVKVFEKFRAKERGDGGLKAASVAEFGGEGYGVMVSQRVRATR